MIERQRVVTRNAWHPEEFRRYQDYLELRRGRRDGALGQPVNGISEAYLEGYILGRKLHFGIGAPRPDDES